MLRYLLVLLAALVVVLAVIFDRPWLSVGAGVLLAGGVGFLAWRLWLSVTEENENDTDGPEASDPRDASLQELGIMEIRPQGEEDTSVTPSREETEKQPPQTTESEAVPSQSPEAPGVSTGPSTGSTKSQESPMVEETEKENMIDRTVVTGDAPVLGPLVQSLRAALGAKTVCLLVQEDMALSYRIEAVASTQPQVRLSGSFNTQTPLLTANMAQRSVSVRSLPEDGLAVEDLGYYQTPPSVDHLAVAPIPRPKNPTSTFLVADGTVDADLGSSQARTILEHYVEVVDLVLAADQASMKRADDKETSRPKGETEDGSSEPASEPDAGPRPRRELIAEEMDAAEGASEGLALVLVHLNRAESIARRGEDAVASAERLFRARLQQAVPSQRVERFGELTYGIFFRGDLNALEPWVADLEATMDAEKGELEGGVSVGASVWSRRDEDPETLRADATEALREAYETGTSTVVT